MAEISPVTGQGQPGKKELVAVGIAGGAVLILAAILLSRGPQVTPIPPIQPGPTEPHVTNITATFQ